MYCFVAFCIIKVSTQISSQKFAFIMFNAQKVSLVYAIVLDIKITKYVTKETYGVDRYTKNGQLAIAGFSDPNRDATTDDLKLWLPLPDSPPPDLDLETSRFLLSQVGDQFCDLLEQEKEAVQIHMSDGNYHMTVSF